MTYSIRATIRAFLAPDHGLSCPKGLWRAGIAEVGRRGEGVRESGAFLLGNVVRGRRAVRRFVYYDDLDPTCLAQGLIRFAGSAYGELWRVCRETGQTVLADVHSHPGIARQSCLDRTNPMIGRPGHVAIIVPDFAQRLPAIEDLGVYVYLGDHRWRDTSGAAASRFFYMGLWS
jgi:proteasome lid subunit RPN8/RPN11